MLLNNTGPNSPSLVRQVGQYVSVYLRNLLEAVKLRGRRGRLTKETGQGLIHPGKFTRPPALFYEAYPGVLWLLGLDVIFKI